VGTGWAAGWAGAGAAAAAGCNEQRTGWFSSEQPIDGGPLVMGGGASTAAAGPTAQRTGALVDRCALVVNASGVVRSKLGLGGSRQPGCGARFRSGCGSWRQSGQSDRHLGGGGLGGGGGGVGGGGLGGGGLRNGGGGQGRLCADRSRLAMLEISYCLSMWSLDVRGGWATGRRGGVAGLQAQGRRSRAASTGWL
jgi:hypothetical protein